MNQSGRKSPHFKKMHHDATLDPNDASLQMGPVAMRMIVPGVIAAIGGGAVAALSFGKVDHEHAPTLFYHAYLTAFLIYLSITLGSLFFVILHHLARSGWSVTLRRLAEALSCNIVLMAVLFVPIGMNLSKVYSWADENKAEASSSEAKPAAESKTDKAEAVKAESAEVKALESEGRNLEGYPGHHAWLTTKAFYCRFIIYFVIWGFLAWYYRGHSILQDQTGNVRLSQSMGRLSPLGMIFFCLALTGTAIDLIMSLNPHWYSTMIGVYFFADSVLSSLAVITLLSLVLQSCGLLRGAVSVEHYHDLGKLTFGFVIFWAYIAFSQYMLIWYANIPEETQFFMPRQIGPWVAVSLALIVIHFVLPFFGLMSRHAKRGMSILGFWLVWLLVAHAYDVFWLIMPNTYIRQLPAGESLPDVFKSLLESQQSVYALSPAHEQFMECVKAPLSPAAIATVIGLIVAMGGLYLASTGWLLATARLAPVKDPRLDEALNFHNV
jgi:hypothetical protein